MPMQNMSRMMSNSLSTQHRLDDYDSPRMTDDVVFVKLKEGYTPGMDDEDEEDYTI